MKVTDMTKPYFKSGDAELKLDGAPINGDFSRPLEMTEALRAFARFMVNGEFHYGSVHEFAERSPMGELNHGKSQHILYKGKMLQFPDIKRLKREAYVVYDDSALEPNDVQKILKVKAGLSRDFLNFPMKFNLLTMMLPSYKFDLSNSNNSDPIAGTEIRIFTYTYLNFSHYPLDHAMEQNVKSMIRLNLLTVCYEASRQKRPLPFIVNPPGAFIRHLPPEKKAKVVQIISDAVSNLWHEQQIQAIVNKWISEWILLQPDFWALGKAVPENVHLAWADVGSIAEELWKIEQALCPVPMMGDPLGPIGNGALGNHANKALDEYLFRACGAIHGLIGSIRYNPDISIFPLRRIVGELKVLPLSCEPA